MVPYIACRSDHKFSCPYVPVFAYINKMYSTPSSPHESTGIWMHKFNNVEAVKMPSYRLHPENIENWEKCEQVYLTDFFIALKMLYKSQQCREA